MRRLCDFFGTMHATRFQFCVIRLQFTGIQALNIANEALQ